MSLQPLTMPTFIQTILENKGLLNKSENCPQPEKIHPIDESINKYKKAISHFKEYEKSPLLESYNESLSLCVSLKQAFKQADLIATKMKLLKRKRQPNASDLLHSLLTERINNLEVIHFTKNALLREKENRAKLNASKPH